VVEAAATLGELLESCSSRKLLITSRELLRIKGELEYPVPPLTEPEGVQLFCERSRLEPDEATAELCRRLDELPLAIELAAARTSVLSPAQILQRLSQRLDLLKGGRDAEERQQTLRATIEWSHDLLSNEEQRLFASLAVFRGGCAVEAAEAVAEADLDTLQSLVDKSLVQHTDERFWMLETIREYARECLAGSGAEAELRRRHALFVLNFAEVAAREMEQGADQVVVLARIGAEHANLRASLEWARDSREHEVLLRLAAALTHYWGLRGFYGEIDTWLPLALERAAAPAQARMEGLRSLCIRATDMGDHARADALVAEWRTLAEQSGDEKQVLLAMNSAAVNATEKGDLDDARAQLTALAAKERASLGTDALWRSPRST
jgi:predicted ATPase